MGKNHDLAIGLASAMLFATSVFAQASGDDLPATSVAVERQIQFVEELAKPTAEARAKAEDAGMRTRMRGIVTKEIEKSWTKVQKQKVKSKSQLAEYNRLLALRVELVAWSDAGRAEAARAVRTTADDMARIFGKKKTPALVPLIQTAFPDLWNPAKASEVEKKLEELIAKNPDAATTGDAHAILGDYRNALGTLPQARSHYLSAQGYPALTRRDGVALRLAWCNLRGGQRAEAISGVKGMLKKPSPAKPEALRSLAFFYAEAGDVQGGTAALKANGGAKLVPEMKFRTATIIGKSPAGAGKALSLFTEYLKEAPDGDLAANAKLAQVALLLRASDYQRFETALKELHKTYAADAAWQKARRDQGKSGAKVTSDIRDLTLVAADNLFLAAAGSANKVLPAKSLTAYGLYLNDKSLPVAEQARVRWSMATLARRVGDLGAAGAQFDALVDLGPTQAVFMDQKTKQKISVHERSARLAVLSYASTPQLAYVNACKKLAGAYPKLGSEIKACDLKTPDVYAALKDPEKQKEALTVVAKKYAKEADGPVAVQKIFKMVPKESAEQLARANDLLTIEAYKSGPVGLVLRDLSFQADLALTRKLEDGLARVDGLARLARDNPKQAVAPTLWVDVAREAQGIGRPLRAVEAYKTLVSSFPQAGVTEGASFALAELLEQLFDLEGAEAAYDTYLQRHPTGGSRWLQAEERRCMLRVALESPKALAACEEFGAKDPNTARRYVERLIARADRDGRVDYLKNLVEEHYLNRYALNPNEQIQANYRVYAAYKRSGDEAKRAEARIYKAFEGNPVQVSGDAKRIVAELKYRGVLLTKTIYDQMNLEGGKDSVDEMVKVIGAKQKALDNLVYNFSKIIDLGDPAWTAACQYQLGAAYESFGSMLQNPPAIRGIAAVDVAIKLADQAAVVRGEAKRFYKLSLETMHRNEVFNEIGAKSVDGIARLDGRAFRSDDWLEAPAYFGSEVPVAVAKTLKGELR